MSGRWSVMWGAGADFGSAPHEIELGPGDVISIPSGVVRCFGNVSTDEAVLMAIVASVPGRADAGRVRWPDVALRQAAAYGPARDSGGDLDIM